MNIPYQNLKLRGFNLVKKKLILPNVKFEIRFSFFGNFLEDLT